MNIVAPHVEMLAGSLPRFLPTIDLRFATVSAVCFTCRNELRPPPIDGGVNRGEHVPTRQRLYYPAVKAARVSDGADPASSAGAPGSRSPHPDPDVGAEYTRPEHRTADAPAL